MLRKPPGPFASSRSRLARGQCHFRNLARKINAYLKDIRCTSFTQKDAQGFEIHKIRIVSGPPIPRDCEHIAAEALEAIRSSLDQAAYAAAVCSGKIAPKSALFPIADSAADLENGIKGRCKDLPPEIVALFRSFKPYKGGNDAIWTMNKLRNMGHANLVAVGAHSSQGLINNAEALGFLEVIPAKWDRSKNELAVFRSLPGTQIKYDVELTFDVVFDKIDTIQSTISVSYIDDMALEASKIIRSTEAECRRLGYIT